VEGLGCKMVNGFRDNTIDLLEALRALDPMVGPVELCCCWFDDLYHPGLDLWECAFSTEEKLALADFNAVFSDVLPNVSEDFQKFQCDPSWQLVSQAAGATLRQLRRGAA